jgi:hypothetical protein
MKYMIYAILLSACAFGSETGEHEGKHKSLEKILNIPKQHDPQASAIDQFQLKEGVVRVWAHSVTDNKSYLLWLREEEGVASKLLEFDESNHKVLRTRPQRIPDWLRQLFDNPLDLTVRRGGVGATIEHSFIIEGVINGKYHWAFRKLDSETKSDYSKLLQLLGEASTKAIDIGWTIETK